MSVLITGIEMPKNDEILCINIKSNGDVYYNLDLGVNTIANAVSVPPHGRLIDTDGKTFPTPHRNPSNDYMKGWNACLRSVQQQPTIIPANKEEHDD